MTDYRDMHRAAYGPTDPNRFADIYDTRSGGSTGILIAIGVIALLVVGALVFAGGSPESTATGQGTQTNPVLPVPTAPSGPPTQ